jgi:hypothetical protein
MGRIEFVIKVLFSGNDLLKCDEFAAETAFKMKKNDHNGDYMRLDDEVYEHVFIGKLGEVAFARFMGNVGFDCVVDFTVYDRFGMDKGDVNINGKIFEVKSCKSGGKVLVEKYETFMRKKRRKCVPDYYVLVEVGWDRKLNEVMDCASILGFVSDSEFIDEENFRDEGSKVLGCPIYKPSYCLVRDELNSDWDSLITACRRGEGVYGY